MTRGVGGQSPSNVQSFLKGVAYPANKQELIKTARKNNAPPEVISILNDFPDDEYGGPQEVMKAYGEQKH